MNLDRLLALAGMGVDRVHTKNANVLTEEILARNHILYERLLSENARFDFLVKTYGEKIEQKYEQTSASEPSLVVNNIERTEGSRIAEKLIRYISQFDPSPKQQYSQWMVVRWLKNGVKLEDLEAIRDMLAIFTEVKQQLTKRDINQYRDKDELEAAVNPFMVSAAAKMPDDERVRQRMMRSDQTTVLYDGPEMRVLVPRTKESAAYWGCTTEWCTTWGMPGTMYPNRTSHYAHYAKQGKLYIITTKNDNALYQFQFETDHYMDARDRSINVEEFIRKYPALLRFIEPHHIEKLLLRGYVPLALIPPERAKQMNPAQALRVVKSEEDSKIFHKLFPQAIEDRETMIELLGRSMSNYDKLSETFRNDPTFFMELVLAYPDAFKALPKKHRSQEMADAMLERHIQNIHWGDESSTWRFIDQNIPDQFRSEPIEEKYYKSKIADNKVSLSDIPERYYTAETIVKKLSAKPSDITAHLNKPYFTNEVIQDVIKSNVDAVVYIPSKMISLDMARYVFQNKRPSYSGERKALYYDKSSESISLGDWIKSLPVSSLDEKMVIYAVTYGKMRFNDVPEKFRTETVISQLLKDAENLKTIPPQYVKPENILSLIDHRTISTIPVQYLSEDIIMKAIAKSYVPEVLYKTVPSQFLSAKVKFAFAKRNSLPISDFPSEFLRDELLIPRIRVRNEEINDVPSSALTTDFVATLAAEYPVAFNALKKKKRFLTREVLRSYVKGSVGSYSQQNGGRAVFKLFDRETWDPDIIANALDIGWISSSFEAIPETKVTDKVAARVIARNPSEIHNSPISVSKDIVLAAVDVSPGYILDIPQDFLDEEVSFKALRYMDKRYMDREKLRSLPRHDWKERTYHEAVGNFLSLKEVPGKFRTPKLVETAVIRDSSNINFIKDPVAYFRKHNIVFQDAEIIQKLRNQGLIFQKKGKKIDVSMASELSRMPLTSKTSYAKNIIGRNNLEYFIFDNKGRVVMRLFEKSNNLKREDALPKNDIKKHVEGIVEFLNKTRHEVGGVSSFPDLADLGIYINAGIFSFWEKLPRKTWTSGTETLEISTGVSKETKTYVIWNRSKPAIRITSIESRSGSYVGDLELLDSNFFTKNKDAIHTFLESKFKYRDAERLEAFGLIQSKDRSSFSRALGQKITSIGDFTIFATETRLALLKNNSGVIAHAVIRKSGAVDKLKFVYNNRITWDEQKALQQRVKDIFAEVETIIFERRKAEVEKQKEERRNARRQRRR